MLFLHNSFIIIAMIDISERTYEAEVWSDFDGTIIESIPTNNITSWMRRPMGGIAGYEDFLRGIQLAEVSVEGVISRRPDSDLWQYFTQRSMARQGLGGYFRDATVHLLASERAKAEWVIDRSRDRVVGIIEDRPHRLGASLLGLLTSMPDDVVRRPIVVGAVQHSGTDLFFEKFLGQAEYLAGAGHDIETTLNSFRAVDTNKVAISVEAENFRLDVVPLPKYSERAGIVVGKYLQAIAEQ